MARVRSLWSTSVTIADACFVLLVVVGGMLLMSGHAVAPGSATKDIAIRLLLAFLAANCSKLVIEQAITFANALARAFVTQGAAQADPHGVADLMKGWLVDNIATLGMLSGLVTLVATVLALIVACGYIMRVTVTMVLIVAAPLALIFHALPQTDGLARLWWRALSGMLAIQVAQSLVFATAVVVLSTKGGDPLPLLGLPGKKGLVGLLLVVCLLYILARIPSWVSKAVWRGALGGNPVGGPARFLFSALVLRRIAGGLSRRGTGPRPFTPPPGPVTPPGPTPVPPPQPPRPRPWVQPELPLQWPSPRGEQLEIPNMPPQRPASNRGLQLQLPLRPAAETPRRWRQGELPVEIHPEQLSLPLRLPNQPVQPPLFRDGPRRAHAQNPPPPGPDGTQIRRPSNPRGDDR